MGIILGVLIGLVTAAVLYRRLEGDAGQIEEDRDSGARTVPSQLDTSAEEQRDGFKGASNQDAVSDRSSSRLEDNYDWLDTGADGREKQDDVSLEPGSGASPNGEKGGPSFDASSDELHWLSGLSGTVAGRNFHVSDNEVTLGRAERCDIQIQQGEVSRIHCRFCPAGSDLMLEATKTVNTTRLNGEVVEPGAPRRLVHGDIIEIGSVVAFKYYQRADFDEDAMLDANVHAGIAAQTKTIGADEESFEQRLRHALERCGGDVGLAAKRLGLEPDALEDLIELYNV